MPAGDGDVCGQIVVGDELAGDELRLSRLGLATGVEEDARPVARDHDAAAEPLPGLVVERVRAKALADAEAVGLVVQVDLDAPLVFGHIEMISPAFIRPLVALRASAVSRFLPMADLPSGAVTFLFT